jgi:hypothetical protein
MTRRLTVVPTLAAALVAAFALSATLVAQQPPGARGAGRGQPPAPSNLQVLPKDISRQDLIGLMRTFNQALGVQCNYCHVAEGPGGRNDYAADEKAPKKAARAMIQLVNHANEMVPGAIGKAPADAVKVQCWTCHRGDKTPTAPPPLPAPAQQAPAGGAAQPGA